MTYADRYMGDEVATERPAPSNVIAALAAIERDLPGISKSQDPNAGINYAYRGIEAITREVQKLLGKYGVVFVPRETGAYIESITVNSKPWTDNFLAVEYDIYGPGGVDDKITVGPIHVQGRDNSDKGYNKARTQAFKYALLQVLSIGDGKDDGDSEAHEADERSAAPPSPPPWHDVTEKIKALSDEGRAKLKQFVAEHQWPTLPKDWTAEHIDHITRKVDALAQNASEQVPPPPNSDAETGGGNTPSPPPVSEPQWDRDSLLRGIKAFEERLDETTYLTYTSWLSDMFGDAGADLTKLDDGDLEQAWRRLDELLTEGVPA